MQRLNRRTLLQAAAALPLIGCQTSRSSGANSYADCHALLDRYVAEQRVSGAVLGVVRENTAPVFISAGTVALDTEQAADPRSIYRIYSMTKPIVGVATLICEAEGLLALDQPLAEIAPEFAAMRVLTDPETMATQPAETAITIRHLLTHTAGFTYHINGDGPLQRLYRENGLFAQGRAYWPQPGDGPLPESLDAFAARLAALPLAAEPGTRWEYSVAFDLLGLVIERAAGMPFADFLAQRIFTPLGMADTGFYVPADKTDRLTSNYLVSETGPQLIDDRSASPFAVAAGVDYGGSGLVSTAQDYAKFCSLLLGGGVVDGRTLAPPEAVRRAGADLLPPAADTTATLRGADFGAGMWIMTEASAKPGEEPPGAYSWAGASGTSMWIDPVNRVGVTLMTQYYPVLAYPLYAEIRQSFYRDL
ncbi:MAG: serine hydrolase domain-containing protein [Hyphomonadaceae bacterium]